MHGTRIKVSRSILEKYSSNKTIGTADEGLVLCLIYNNKESLADVVNSTVDQKLQLFLEGIREVRN